MCTQNLFGSCSLPGVQFTEQGTVLHDLIPKHPSSLVGSQTLWCRCRICSPFLRANLCPSLNLIFFPLAAGRLFSQERDGNSCSQCWKLKSVTCLSDSFVMAFPLGQAQRKQETSMWGEMVFPLNPCLDPSSLRSETKAWKTSWFCSNFSKDNNHRVTVWNRKRKINGNITSVPFSMDEKCFALKNKVVINDKDAWSSLSSVLYNLKWVTRIQLASASTLCQMSAGSGFSTCKPLICDFHSHLCPVLPERKCPS